MQFPDFIASLTRHGKDRDIYQFLSRKEKNYAQIFLVDVALFEGIYNLAKRDQAPRHTIPKTIHQIWLGKNKVPADCKRWMASWQKLEGITYKLWTDADMVDFPFANRTLFDSCENLGAKSDILRYEILYHQGGLYLDTDIECLSPGFFIQALERYDFFAGTEPLTQALDIWIGNSLIASMPGHPLLKRVIENLPQTYPTGNRSPVFVTGPGYFIKQIKQVFLENMQMCAQLCEHLAIFPTGFFNPISLNESWLLGPSKNKLHYPETVSVHYFKRIWDKALNISQPKRISKEKELPSFFSALQRHGKDRGIDTHLTLFKRLRKSYDLLKKTSLPSKKIPKIFHQIDVKSNDVDRDRYMVTWMGIKGFEYKLWSQQHLENEFPFPNLQFSDAICQEILKFEILYREGGIFVDPNFFCLDECFFNWVAERCDSFSGMLPLTAGSRLTISSALIGVKPKHPLIKRCLERLKKERNEDFKASSIFTEEFLAYMKNELVGDFDVILPPTFFNPLTEQESSAELPLDDETAAVRDRLSKVKKRLIT